MKKIINGKKYDTETAGLICSRDFSLEVGSFGYYSETLYKKKTGEFFLYGEGGALTKYAEITANGMKGGERIIPLTEEQAKAWAEENLSVDDYEKIFGEVEE